MKDVLRKDPYIATMRPNIFDRPLPCLPSSRFRLTRVEDGYGLTCTIPDDVLYLYGTSYYITTIDNELTYRLRFPQLLALSVLYSSER
jgi:hypothetical protein